MAAQGVHPTYVQYVEGSADQAIYDPSNGQMNLTLDLTLDQMNPLCSLYFLFQEIVPSVHSGGNWDHVHRSIWPVPLW
jgi:hypothetical protein